MCVCVRAQTCVCLTSAIRQGLQLSHGDTYHISKVGTKYFFFLMVPVFRPTGPTDFFHSRPVV